MVMKYLKAAGIAAALALMIPLSAYAAEAEQVNSSSAAVPEAIDSGTDLPVQTQTDAGGGHFHFGHHGHGGMGGLIGQEVLTLLKLDQDALRQKLKEGQTLAQIAKGQGVSRDELKKVLTESFAKKQDEKKQRFTSNLDRIVDMKFQPGKGYGRGNGGGYIIGKGSDLSALAKQLGISSEELRQALASGKTLADLAKEKGVDVQKLITVQKNVMVDRINQAVKDGKLTREQADKQIAKAGMFAEKIVNRNFDRGRHH
jgi:lambda repressor-like predicted transcriptional regulator